MMLTMRSSLRTTTSLILLLLVSVHVGAQEEEEVDESEVLVLGSSNFNQAVQDSKYVMVEFYAPWCGHCQHLKPEYARAALTLKEMDIPVKLAKVDATQEEDLSQEYDVQGFPTMKWFVDGKATDKQIMVRQEDEIIRWVKKHTGPPAATLETSADITSKTEELKSITVGFFDDIDSEEYSQFVELASHDDAHDYFLVTEKQTIKDEGVTVVPKVIFYRSFDEPKVVYGGKFDQHDLLKAVQKNSRPKVIDMTEETAQQIFDNELPKVLIFRAEGEVKEEFKEVAHEDAFVGKYIFATVGENGDPELGKFLGVNQDSTDTELFIFNVEDGSKFRMEPPVNKDGIVKFLKSFEEGTASQFLKSAPVKEGWDAEPVKDLVASQWDEFIKQDAHVVVEFYAPWCGHCQQLEPKYKKVAQYLEDKYHGEVVLAKIDATENEIPEIRIQGFPTVLVIAKDKKGETPEEFPQDELTDVQKIVKKLKKMLKLEDKKREGEEDYQAAAKRFKLAVKALKQGSLKPAAEALNKAAETVEALVAKDEL